MCKSSSESLEDLDFGLSPSGKAQDFDSCISLVRIQLAQLEGFTFMGFNLILEWDISSGGRALDF